MRPGTSHPPADLVPPTPGSSRPVVTVGVLITIALAILVGGAIWLARPGGPVYYVEVADAMNLRVGAEVRFRGMPVGRVDDIAFTDTSVRIRMRLTRDVPVREGASARVTPTGLIGDAIVELLPSATPSAPPLAPGSTLARAAPDSARIAEQERARAALANLARDVIEGRHRRDSSTRPMRGAPARADSARRP